MKGREAVLWIAAWNAFYSGGRCARYGCMTDPHMHLLRPTGVVVETIIKRLNSINQVIK
jgi:hypothetical protein